MTAESKARLELFDGGVPSRVVIPPTKPSWVLYLLHGRGDDEASWLAKGAAAALLERAPVAALVAMPFGFVTRENHAQRKFPTRQEFARSFDTFIARFEREHAALLSGDVRRAVAGLSMGGKQALEYGFDNAVRFDALGAFSPAIQTMEDAMERSVRSRADARPRLFVSCGVTEEHAAITVASERLRRCLAPSDRFESLAGGHDWQVWQESLRRFLAWL